MNFELTFSGAAIVRQYSIPSYVRYHVTLDDARSEATRVLTEMNRDCLPADAHAPIIYGPNSTIYSL